jgi:hypothetical protein
VSWNVFLFHILSKQLIKSRSDFDVPARCLRSVLLSSTCFRTLWSDGMMSLLPLFTRGPDDLRSWTVRAYPSLPDCPALVSKSSDVRRMGDCDRMSDRASP